MKRSLIFITLLLLLVAACGNKDKQSSLTGGSGGGSNYKQKDDSFLYIELPEKFYNYDYQSNEIKAFATNNPVININTECSGNFANFDAVNLANNYTVNVVVNNENNKCPIENMHLVEGENLIDTIKYNSHGKILDHGQMAYHKVIAIYNPTVDFLGKLEFSKNGIFENEHLMVSATIPINLDTIPDKGSVGLFIKKDGKWEYFSTMNDDGADGDKVAGDGTYSVEFSSDLFKEGDYMLRVMATANGKENFTPYHYLRIYPSDLTQKMQLDSDLANEIVKKYFEGVDEGDTLEEVIQYRKWVSEQIKDTPGLVSSEVSEGGTFSLQFKYLYGYDVFVDYNRISQRAWDKYPDMTPPSPVIITDETRKSFEEYKNLYRKLIMSKSNKFNILPSP